MPRVAGMRLHLGFSAWEGHSAELPSQSHSLNEPSSRENCFLSKVPSKGLLAYGKGQLFLPLGTLFLHLRLRLLFSLGATVSLPFPTKQQGRHWRVSTVFCEITGAT